MAIDKKTTALFKLMERFLIQKEISNDDPYLLDEFDCSSKTLERYLNEIELLYNHIITIKQSRKKVWKLVRVSDIFQEFINNSEEIGELFLLAQEFDPTILKDLEDGTLSKIAKNDESLFLFRNTIMEEIQSDEAKQIFRNLKSAIRNNEYRDIVFKTTQAYLKDVKCIKLIFIDNNWYLAYVEKVGGLQFARLSFMQEVRYSSKNTFQTKDIQKYLDFLANIQNAMTLYGVEPKTATIKALPGVAKYFDKGMKKFLSSQTFMKKEEDGSVVFSVKYTQPLEILPFIQKWMPDLLILEPESLQKAYKKKLQKALSSYNDQPVG